MIIDVPDSGGTVGGGTNVEDFFFYPIQWFWHIMQYRFTSPSLGLDMSLLDLFTAVIIFLIVVKFVLYVVQFNPFGVGGAKD